MKPTERKIIKTVLCVLVTLYVFVGIITITTAIHEYRHVVQFGSYKEMCIWGYQAETEATSWATPEESYTQKERFSMELEAFMLSVFFFILMASSWALYYTLFL